MKKDGSEFEQLSDCGKPLWLVAELTYKCPLKCPWCTNPMDFDDYTDELSTEDWLKALREARELGSLQLGFSGGEPMVRKDLEILVDEADKMGYYTNLITSGMGLTEERLIALKEAGLKQIQLSFQHSDKETNDLIVGATSFDKKMDCIRMIKKHGFPMVLNVPISRLNIDAVEDLIDLCEENGIEFLELANIQYYNWALLNRNELLPSLEQLQEAEAKVEAARERLGNKVQIFFVIPDYYDGRPKACMGGWGSVHLSITPNGQVLPCHEAQVIPGIEFPNVREKSVKWIWEDSQAFNEFRGDDWMKEPCSGCEEKKKDFGGCRCQAYLLTGDARNADPACSKAEHFNVVQSAVENAKIQGGPRMPLVMRAKGAVSPKINKGLATLK
ncbi:pyrroloquinoline quinone biosynthesis protein PqqE [Terasakiella sp. A23]|uniref:pyrroloquinoline quinone biosynthesis protein PqqE n=1 Tax=Terasakiella sp. FCG-A23 TaxID=3080561 RepID=UPI002952C2AF|nr:pyrroloquinoline quinone biosynthesis protein PqqE [Terasakiella sp. A23]MDV7339325.1 pyrroloquinoline quinone biosynthesis protein PqqE [Terasakiella sp. A23]